MPFVDDRYSRQDRTGRHGPDLLYRLAEHERRAAEAAARADAREAVRRARAAHGRTVRLQCPIRLRSPVRVVPPREAS